MSKKVDHPELRAQLETLNNKELHYKCVEHGMNVPVADSTRDVIIRKLIKSITGDSNLSSPKANKKQVASPSERRKTVNVTVHVSSDEEEAGRQKQRSAIKNKTRTQSPKGHNVTFDSVLNNNRSNITATKATTVHQIAKSADTNANIGIGFGNSARNVPLEVHNLNNINHDIDEIEIIPSNLDDGYKSTSTNLNFSQTRTYGQDRREIPISTYKSSLPNLGFSQTRTLNTTQQQNEAEIPRQGFFSTPPEHTINRPVGFYSSGSPINSFNIENMASHSSTLGGSLGGSYSKDPVFKRPTAISKSNVTNTTYNQADAQRLYPRLPTDLPTPSLYTVSPPSTPDSQKSTNSSRAPSLTKSGVMTTSYYQEITPVKEVKHFEVESEEEPSMGGGGDHNRRTMPMSTNYDRSSNVAGIKHGSEAHLPFESHLQSPLNFSSRYTSAPLNKESYIPTNSSPKAQSSPNVKRYSTTARANTSYTRSVDEPDSCSDGEQLSSDEIYVQDSEEEEYLAEGRKIYSSYGSNKIQERVPYRRSNSGRLSASPGPRYSSAAMGRHSLNPDDDDDDVNASLKNFLTTLDRKYHIKQMLYMFAVFALAVFIYVVFFEKTAVDEHSS